MSEWRTLRTGTRQETVNDTVQVWEDPDYPMVRIGNRIVAKADDDEFNRLARISLKIKKLWAQGKTIAIIGGGLYLLPRFLWPATCTIYEVEAVLPPLANEYFPWASNRWTHVVGDWHSTLSGNFDFIVHDLGSSPTPEEEAQLRAHLNPGGVLL